nr:hypothetical protein [uncultured Prevotella sp.]
MKKRIDTTREMRQRAMKVFHVTEQTVFNAICFDSKRGNTDKAKRIRSYILQNGGIVMVELPEVETIHDAEGYMRQYFPNGAMIEVNKITGDLTSYYKGAEMIKKENVSVRQLAEVQDIMSLWTQRDADIYTNPELYKKHCRLAGVES